MQDTTDTEAVTAMDSDGYFASSAGKQLGLYALYAFLGLSVLIYVLSVAAGNSGGIVSGGAIDVERNSITIVLSEEPPQLDSTRSTDAVSFVVLAHTIEG